MRIDDTAFDETLIELIDLQSIDCRSDWLSGLKSLLALLERDRVPRSPTFKADQFSDLINRFDQPPLRIAEEREVIISNLLPLLTLPQQLNFFSCSGVQSNEMPNIAAKLNVPAFAHYAHIATTASLDRFTKEIGLIGISTKVGERAVLSWQDFLNADCGDLPAWKKGDARNKAFALLSKAWDLNLRSSGTSVSLLANNRPFWFFADQHFPDNKIRFTDFSSRLIRRQLVGFSAKRRVFWHFGLQARPLQLDGEFFFSVTPHVTFSANGTEPLASKGQLHSLRRSFCRSWWNDRWRDLLQAFLAALAGNNQPLRLDIGAAAPLEISNRFLEFYSPVRLQDVAEERTQAAVKAEDDVEDQWDDDLEDAEWLDPPDTSED